MKDKKHDDEDDEPSKKARRREKRARVAAEQRSDRTTAADIVSRMECVQDELGDLIYEFRYLNRMDELHTVAYAMWMLDKLRAKCNRFAEGRGWGGD